MAESIYKYNAPYNTDGNIPWPFEERSFFGEDFTSAVNYLNIKEEEVDSWRENGFAVFQIGTGQGAAIKQLRERNINVIGIEPALTFSNSKESLLKDMQSQGVKEYIYPKYAAELIGDKDIEPASQDIVFANGPNFHDYAQGKKDLLVSLCGIFRTLKKEKHACLILRGHLDENNRMYIYMFATREHLYLDELIEKYDAGIEYTLTNEGYPAIRVYRINKDGKDLLPHLFDESGIDTNENETNY